MRGKKKFLLKQKKNIYIYKIFLITIRILSMDLNGPIMKFLKSQLFIRKYSSNWWQDKIWMIYLTMNGWDFKEFNAYSYLENFQDPNLVFSSN